MSMTTRPACGVLALAWLAMVTGCATQDTPRDTTAALPATWQATPHAPTASPAVLAPVAPWRLAQPNDATTKGPWWTAFNDARLNELQDQALAQNQTLQIAAARLRQAHAAFTPSGPAPSGPTSPPASARTSWWSPAEIANPPPDYDTIVTMRRAFVTSLLLAFFAFATLFGLEFLLEWNRLGRPGVADMSWVGTNNAKLVDLLSPMARAYNNVLAMLLATIGLAIPLTANMHTPKLIDMFLRDRINRFVLSFMALGAAHVLFVAYIIGPNFAPIWAVRLAVFASLVGWALLIPYFFYVVRFLDPSRVVRRLSEESQRLVEQVAAGKRDPVTGQEELAQRLDQLGTIILKSLDRADRGVAREGVWALKQLMDHHAARKGRMPAAWFRVDRADFVGLSDEALAMVTESHTWFEMKCGLQLALGYQLALSKASDTVSSISDANRVIALRAAARGDDEALRLAIRFFNNFTREAIKARGVHAVYDVFHQYRLLAKDLVDRDELIREIARHFVYYANMAYAYGLVFAPQLAVFDLGYVVRRAYESKSPAGSDLLGVTLGLPHRHGTDVHTLAVKAKLILGGFFLETGLEAEAARVGANLADVDPAEIRAAADELLDSPRVFFEVTDRQLNFQYVPPERREPLQRFCAQLAGAPS